MRLWFVMPVHERFELTAICLRQLRRTCDLLTERGLDASCVVIGDDRNLDTADGLGFGTIRRENDFLARKYNDGFQLAFDREHNPRPVDYAVPIGSDDWIDSTILKRLPRPNEVLGFRQVAFVNETGRELTQTLLAYDGGVGIRVYPRELLKAVDYRPADEDRKRACDTSILYNTRRENDNLQIRYGDRHPLQIVDWKTAGHQMNTYKTVARKHRGLNVGDPFEMLSGVYPDKALSEMRALYGR